jgi:hypothetical protein
MRAKIKIGRRRFSVRSRIKLVASPTSSLVPLLRRAIRGALAAVLAGAMAAAARDLWHRHPFPCSLRHGPPRLRPCLPILRRARPTSPPIPLLRRASSGAILSDVVGERGTKSEAPRCGATAADPCSWARRPMPQPAMSDHSPERSRAASRSGTPPTSPAAPPSRETRNERRATRPETRNPKHPFPCHSPKVT